MTTTRSLEGQIFYTDYNNGVTALVNAGIYLNMRKVLEISNALTQHAAADDHMRIRTNVQTGLAHMPSTSIFTFARFRRVQEDPWLTGSNKLLQKLVEYITRNGGRVERRSFHVPFSNQSETGLHGDSAQIDELRHVTSRDQFVDTFGISPIVLMPEIDGPLSDEE